MFRLTWQLHRYLWILLAVSALPIAVGSNKALAQLTPGYTEGRWVIGSTAACQTRYYRWTFVNGEARFIDQQGVVSIERVTQWLPSGFLSTSVISESSGTPARWEYRFLGSNSVQVNNLTGARSFVLNRCPAEMERASTPAPTPPPTTSQNRIGPSFDCALAKDALAGLICGNDQLAWLDLRFTQAYQAMRQQAGDAGQVELRQEAIDFQTQVYALCRLPKAGFVPPPARPGAEACVARAYQQQRNVWAGRLSAVFQDEANRPLQQHIQLQGALQDQGYIPATSRIDGVYGPATRSAITAWQITHNLPSTATLSASEAQLLTQNAPGAPTPLPAATPTYAQPPPAPSLPSRAEIKADEERRLAISRADAEKAKAEADKAQAEADRVRAEAEVFAAKERAEAEARRKAAEQARAEQEAHGIQP